MRGFQDSEKRSRIGFEGVFVLMPPNRFQAGREFQDIGDLGDDRMGFVTQDGSIMAEGAERIERFENARIRRRSFDGIIPVVRFNEGDRGGDFLLGSLWHEAAQQVFKPPADMPFHVRRRERGKPLESKDMVRRGRDVLEGIDQRTVQIEDDRPQRGRLRAWRNKSNADWRNAFPKSPSAELAPNRVA